MPDRPAPPDRPARRKPGRAASPAAAARTGERIAKVLARAGIASRREAEAMIQAGRVQVNGRTIESPALNVAPSDRVLVDGKPLAAREPMRLWRYYKPVGLVTSARDEKGRPTVFDSLPADMPRVVSVGRLDLNSEGLLLLTNDGELKRRLELPSTGWLRRYRVRVHGTPTNEQLAPLEKGITLGEEHFQPMIVTLDRQQGANAWLSVGIREGRNREIRRAMEAVGLTVNRLIRVGYGPFQLGDLEPGEVEEIRPRVLRDQLGLPPEAVAGDGAGRPGPARGPAGKPPGATRSGPRAAAPARPERPGADGKGAGRKGEGKNGAGTGGAASDKPPPGKGAGGKGAGGPRRHPGRGPGRSGRTS